MNKTEQIYEMTAIVRRFPPLEEKRIAEALYAAGYRKLPERPKVLPVPSHSESIWCPHCGEEFGIESNIEYARQAQLEADIKHYEGG